MSKKAATIIAIPAISFSIFVFSCFGLSEIVKSEKEELFRQLEIFSDALTIVKEDYVEDAKPKDLIYGALKGMLSALDPYSQFLDPDTYNELKVDTEGQFGGLGIEITIQDGLLTVVTPIEGTPAWDAGIKPGDKIVKIEGEITRDITLIEAVKKLRGKPDEPVNLTVLREPENKLLEFKVVRAVIKITDIKEALILEDDIAYIRLTEFRENTPKDFSGILDDLNRQGMQALILDLRNNPGGLLDAAIKVTEKFIQPGKLLVYTKGRKPSQNIEFFSKEKNPLLDVPIVVLINQGSASGSEIVAAALQDYKRAIILGKKSFGKGSVQTIVPLSDGSAIRLTTSKYYTASGKEIHNKGVIPDIEVGELALEKADYLGEQAEELEQVFEKLSKEEEQQEDREKEDFYKRDNQIMHAIDVLKAVRIYGKLSG
ncbi:MAG: peptidase S41 [Candidatus Omnitrophota bacterium]|nr:MAG: peptidase S41 [Candidatus Omnitrophota bacterium]